MSIYKYLAADRVQALDTATLRATQASALNDPFELKPFFRTVFGMNDLNRVLDERASNDSILDEVYARLPDQVRSALSRAQIRLLLDREDMQLVLNRTRQEVRTLIESMLPDLSERARKMLHDKLEHMVGIVSFTDDPQSHLMWAHYASEHKGFVIEFDEAQPFFDQRRSAEDEFLHLRPVQYMPASHVHESLGDLDGTAVLCVKQSDWAYERELRLLVPVNPADQPGINEPVHLVHFPRSCVQRVILGHRASDTVESELREILQRHAEYANVEVWRASADYSSGLIAINPT